MAGDLTGNYLRRRSGLWACLVSYPDPGPTAAGGLHHATYGDVIHPQLWEPGSGYETMGCPGVICSPVLREQHSF